MLQTKSIIKDKETSDWLRISVMSRHTLDDWKTVDTRIIEWVSYDLWNKILAPEDKLVWVYYRWELNFEEYKKNYIWYLRKAEVSKEVEKLTKDSLDKVITILCIEDEATFCHRKILAEECQKYHTDLLVKHL